MRKLITVIFSFCGAVAMAQTSTEQYNTYSPYSIFGIGQKRFNGTAETQSMGGIGVAYSMVGVTNVVNPASLTQIRQTVYTIGTTGESINYSDGKQTGTSTDAYFDYLVFSVPLSAKSGVQFGLAPYTVTGYSVYSADSILVDGSYKGLLDYYSGNGGVNMVYLAAGYEVLKNLSIGVNAAYLFGSIDRSSYNYVEDRLSNTKIWENNWVNGFKFKVGLNYNFKLKEEMRMYLGATYEFSAGLKTDRTYSEYTVNSYDDDFDEDNPQNYQTTGTYTFSIPQTIAVGVGVGDIKRWYIGLEGEYTAKPDWGKVDYVRTDASYQSGKRIALGGNYIPNYNSTNSYFSRIRYSAGLYYNEQTYQMRSQTVNDYGVTLGAALPMTKIETQTMALSNFNIFLNYGVMGKEKGGMVKENYFKIGISFALNDRWFLKQKFY